MLIGVTGGIGAGKSTLARALQGLGADRIDADRLGHHVLNYPEIIAALRRCFDASVFSADGHVDRQRLGRLVFADPVAKERLEAIVRPCLDRDIQAATADHDGRVVVLDAPLIYEWDIAGRLDCVVVVDADEAVCVQRVVQRSGLSPEQIKLRMAAQMDPAEKRRRADYVVVNNDSTQHVANEALRLWRLWGLEVKPEEKTPAHG
jgi:dephospho-CoA kinase